MPEERKAAYLTVKPTRRRIFLDNKTYRTNERYEARCPASYCGATVFQYRSVQTKANGKTGFFCWRCGMEFSAAISHLFRVDDDGQRIGLGPPKEVPK